MEGSDFTIKEIVIETNNNLAKLADEIRTSNKEVDGRLDDLEQHKASVVSNFKLAAWIFGAAISIGGLLVALKLI